MNIKEFKNELLKGHGRCYLELKKNPSRYKNVILWACKHQISWDTQSEGTRSGFLYSLINCYSDKTIFLDTIINEFNKTNDNTWMFLYLCEVLNYFSLDGATQAGDALDSKYKALFDFLLHFKKRKQNAVLFQLGDFEQLCVVKCRNIHDFIHISNDIGYLLENNKLFTGFDFDWYIDKFVEKYERRLLKEINNNINLSRIYQEYRTIKAELEEYRKRAKTEADRKERKIKQSSEAKEKYLNSKTNEEKTDALKRIYFCQFSSDQISLDPNAFINDAESENPDLRNAALSVLGQIRNKIVRDWVIPKSNENIYRYLPIYIRNYKSGDLPEMLELLKKAEFGFFGDGEWHEIVSAILNMQVFMPIPKELLLFVYENSYCGTCKAIAFRHLKRRHLLTKEIIEECNYDANNEIFY